MTGEIVAASREIPPVWCPATERFAHEHQRSRHPGLLLCWLLDGRNFSANKGVRATVRDRIESCGQSCRARCQGLAEISQGERVRLRGQTHHSAPVRGGRVVTRAGQPILHPSLIAERSIIRECICQQAGDQVHNTVSRSHREISLTRETHHRRGSRRSANHYRRGRNRRCQARSP